MNLRHCAAILFILSFLPLGTAASQTLLDSLRPQPRQAYVRMQYSAVFSPAPGQSIFLDPAAPDWKQAAVLNAGLRAKGNDTLLVRPWTEADTLGAGVYLGVHSRFLNDMLARIPDQRISVSAVYPGPEGYVLDGMPARVLIVGSDAAGVGYGVSTLLQLLYPLPQWWGLQAFRIVDVPEFPIRWFYHSTNIQVGQNITNAKALWDKALRWRLNGVNLNDSKFARPTTLPDFYFDSLASLLRYAADRNLRVIPGVMQFGYSNALLFHNPNLASGLPVRQQRFRIEADTARLIPHLAVHLTNGGFETHTGDTFPGFRFIDKPGQISFADTQVKHGGAVSIRFENFAQVDPQYGHGRISFWTKVAPYTQYHVGAWVRTENLSPSSSARINVIPSGNRTLTFNEFSIPATTNGWRKLDFTFNSLDEDSLGIYWGVWGARSGKIWWDDLVIEEVPFINLIRRPGAPLTVAHPVLGIVYTEGTDFAPLKDPLMGSVPYLGEYTLYHNPPTLRRLAGGMLKNGDEILVSYCHATTIYGWQVMIAMSEPETYEIVEREFRVLDSLIQPAAWFMHHDEIRVMNWDPGDQQRGLTPAQILADNVNKCLDIIHRPNRPVDAWVWSDMFDEFHNAVPADYYLVNGDLTGSADLLPKSLGIVNWNGRDGIVQKSLDFFATRGFRQISAPYYDGDENDIRIWKEWTRGTPNFLGMMYTTWQSKYDHLEPFGEYAWNHAPYIYHQPPDFLPPVGPLSLFVTISGDRWDGGWALDNAQVLYRTAPGMRFTAFPFTAAPGQQTQVDLPLPAGTKWIQWYVNASDNRGWSTRVPFGDTVYFELGSISTALDSPPRPGGFQIFGAYPNPSGPDGTTTVEWSSGVEDRVEIIVRDVLGRELLRSIGQPERDRVQGTKISLSRFPAGMYFIRVTSPGGSGVVRVVKR